MYYDFPFYDNFKTDSVNVNCNFSTKFTFKLSNSNQKKAQTTNISIQSQSKFKFYTYQILIDSWLCLKPIFVFGCKTYINILRDVLWTLCSLFLSYERIGSKVITKCFKSISRRINLLRDSKSLVLKASLCSFCAHQQIKANSLECDSLDRFYDLYTFITKNLIDNVSTSSVRFPLSKIKSFIEQQENKIQKI